MNKFIIAICILLALLPALSYGSSKFIAYDRPSDDGKAVDLSWSLPDGYQSIRIEKLDSAKVWVKIASPGATETFFSDNDTIEPDNKYEYRLVAYTSQTGDSLVMLADAIPSAQWFNQKKLPLLLSLFVLCLAIIYYILSARSGKDLFIRRINGLESMDEAVGRATEKGKPILFVPGIGDLDDIQTIAALTILSQLAYKAASYNADLIVPVCRSMVLSTAREVVKEAYLKAGRPDAFKQDNIFYLTDDQFGYVAGIDGIMVREQPAANFFLGTFYAEALILAETGFGTGAMQTAGTAQPHQLPFFVVSCDYTLIGEELFAASAYLSKEPHQLGSLKGQDFGKVLVVLLILVGSLLEISGIHWLKNILIVE